MHRFDLFPNNDLIEQYRRVFSSRNGIDVLNHMLYDLGLFVETKDNPVDVALRNYAIRLITILGGDIPSDNAMELFTKKLMKQPLKKETIDE